MFPPAGSLCGKNALAALVISLAAGSGLLVGCGQPVQEDRTITWSSAAKATSFHHGTEGVFLTHKGRLEKIFTPGDDVAATSTPQWSPDGTRLVFLTAQVSEFDEIQTEIDHSTNERSWDASPDGRLFIQFPVAYTCWLYAPSDQGETEPVRLFEAACDHSGYVAANLAVRWHPDGNRLAFLDQPPGQTCRLFEYHLESGQRSEIPLPFAASALLFDWMPHGDAFVCLAGSHRNDASQMPPPGDGIWMNRPDTGEWWHVPESERLPDGAQPSLIEQLRALRPVWNATATGFVFVTRDQPAGSEDDPLYRLLRADPAARQVETVYEAPARIRDVHWSPRDDKIGLLIAGEGRSATLQIIDRHGHLLQPSGRHPIRNFAGWNRDGRHVAYVIPQHNATQAVGHWAFLLSHIPAARDTLAIADGTTLATERPVLSDMRFTFVNWSPNSPELSLWATFVPSYRSWLLRQFGFSLSPGDPAATLNVESGAIQWMPIDVNEKAQVGHYYMLQRNFEEALSWYEAAQSAQAESDPFPGTTDPSAQEISMQATAAFHGYCLHKLGRTEEAHRRFDDFRQSFSTAVRERFKDVASEAAGHTNAASSNKTAPPISPQALAFRERLLQDLLIAEILLSTGQTEDAEPFFRHQMNEAEVDTTRLSSAIVLSQILLIAGKHQEYAELATETIGPLAISLWQSFARDEWPSHSWLDESPQSLLVYAGASSLLPLFSQEFLSGLPLEQVHAILARWERLAESCEADVPQLAADLVLVAGYEVLQDGNSDRFRQRLETNPATTRFVPPEGIEEAIRKARQALNEDLEVP